ncbi:MAG: VanZ family protein [Erysipelotrichaceae bacterium]|nr:VanZ family protein [Erysipelotrichaceae bacterium]
MNPKVKVRLRIIAIFTTLIWMIVIFRFSMDTGTSSHGLSSACVTLFNKAIYYFTGKDLTIAISPSHYAYIELFFRKLAHMSIYFILSINVMVVLFTFNMKMSLRMFLSLLLCFLYALTDEFHQLFVDGRGASFVDCLIDTSGAFVGIFAALILYCIMYTMMIKYQKHKGRITVTYENI